MNSARVCVYMYVVMAVFGCISCYIISESQSTKNLFKDQHNDEIENKIYFLTKLLQEVNSLGDTGQSTKDVAALKGSESSVASHENSEADIDTVQETFNTETADVNSPVNAESKVRTTPDDALDTHHSKSQENGASLTKGEHSYEDLASLSNKDKSFIKDEFKAIEDFVRLFDEKRKQNPVKVEKKNYAILPPASEWCRLMGFRRCHGNQS